MNENKLISLKEAAALVQPGDVLALGGMTLYRRPVAFVRELLRRSDAPGDLTLLCFTAGYESDLLVGAGLVSKVRSCYFGLEIFGLAPMYSLAGNAGTIHIIEESESSLAIGLRATMGQLEYLPSLAWVGTDMLALRPDVKLTVDPYSGETLTAFPAIGCDVAVIHALVADKAGNARLNANLGVDQELAMVADTVIVTAEEVVDSLTEDVTVAGPVITAVVHAPHGAWPTSCYPLYPVAGGELLAYIDACNGNRFNEYVAGLANP